MEGRWQRQPERRHSNGFARSRICLSDQHHQFPGSAGRHGELLGPVRQQRRGPNQLRQPDYRTAFQHYTRAAAGRKLQRKQRGVDHGGPGRRGADLFVAAIYAGELHFGVLVRGRRQNRRESAKWRHLDRSELFSESREDAYSGNPRQRRGNCYLCRLSIWPSAVVGSDPLRRAGAPRLGPVQLNVEAKQRAGLVVGPASHSPLGAKEADIGVAAQVELQGISAAVRFLGEGRERPPTTAVRRAPHRDVEAFLLENAVDAQSEQRRAWVLIEGDCHARAIFAGHGFWKQEPREHNSSLSWRPVPPRPPSPACLNGVIVSPISVLLIQG